MADTTSYPIVGAIVDCKAVQLSKGYFLALFDRTFPFEYLYPMKTNPDSGYEQFQGTAAMGERGSLAVFRLERDNLISCAPVGAKASGTVEFSRPTFAAGAITIEAGTVVTTSKGDKRFILQEQVVFGSTDLGPKTGAVLAEGVGYEYNVLGAFITAAGEEFAGEIDTIHLLYTTPAYGDITFIVEQPDDITGGAGQALEALALDRGLFRGTNELEETFRLRVKTLPDTVSPNAITRTVQAIMGVYGFCFREVGTELLRGMFYDGDVLTDVDKMDFYDVDSLAFDGSVTSGSFLEQEPVELRDSSSNIIASGWFGSLELSATRFWMIRKQGHADAGGGITIVGVYSGAIFTPSAVVDTSLGVLARRFRLNLDYTEFRGFFLIGLPRLNLNEFGMAYDDGPRNAYDYTTTVAPAGPQNFFDGYPVGAFRLYTAVYDAVNSIKAGGVSFDIYIEDIGCN